MIAKLIVRGPNRRAAIQKLHAALQQYEIAGPTTNIDFIKRVCRHPAFIAGDVETGFIPNHRDELFREIAAPPEVFAQAAIGSIMRGSRTQAGSTASLPIRTGFTSGFQVREVAFTTGGDVGGKDAVVTRVQLKQTGPRTFDVNVGEHIWPAVQVKYSSEAHELSSFFPHTRLDSRVVFHEGDDADKISIFQQGNQYELRSSTPGFVEKALGLKDLTHSVLAPMPCKVLRVDVEEGDEVRKDQALVVIESMKMETVIRSPHDGVVARVVHKAGVSCATPSMLLRLCSSADLLPGIVQGWDCAGRVSGIAGLFRSASRAPLSSFIVPYSCPCLVPLSSVDIRFSRSVCDGIAMTFERFVEYVRSCTMFLVCRTPRAACSLPG